jgi:hypothetical protein
MGKKTGLVALCCLFCTVLLSAADRDARIYSEVHGSTTSVVEYAITRAGNAFDVTSTGGPVTDAIHWIPGTGTVSWKEIDPGSRIDMQAVRTGDVVHVTGTHKGVAVSLDVRLDSAPWYQIFGPLIAELLPGLTGQREFWVLNMDDLVPHKMLVRRVGQERIQIHGAAIDALKIHFSPAGVLAPFWGADFWYRPADNVYLYSRLPENGELTVSTIEDPAK